MGRKLIEVFFPQNNIRYIAVNDGVDSSKGDNELCHSKILLMNGMPKPLVERLNPLLR